MVSSKETTPAAYIASLAAEQRTVIEAVRAVVKQRLPKGYVETMNWGMLSYEIPLSTYPDTYNKQPLMYVALAAQKGKYALYTTNVRSTPARSTIALGPTIGLTRTKLFVPTEVMLPVRNRVLPCDVARDEDIEVLFGRLASEWDGLDGIVHSIAFAPREALKGEFLEGLTRDAFRIAHDVSAYSFAALAKAGLPLMEGRKASLLTLTYLGAERAVPNYNVMGLAKASLEAAVRYLAQDLGPKGIRVNGISAGPIKTLAAAGISGFGKILKFVENNAPLRRNVTIDDVGNAAAFLMSDLAAGITGEITYVDAGFNTVVGGMRGES